MSNAMNNIAADEASQHEISTTPEDPSHTTPYSSSSAAPTPIPNIAAPKVFAMPELLELILLELSALAKNCSTVYNHTMNKKPKYYQGPAKDLFVLQRVNSTFQATIVRNKIMQQRMFLEASPAPLSKPPEGTIRKNPFQWMLAEVGIVVEAEYRNEEWDLLGKPHDLVAYPADIREKSMDNSEHASWRKMKLHGTRGQEPIAFFFESRDKCFRVASLAEEDNMTLGDLYEGLMWLAPLLGEVDATQVDYQRVAEHFETLGDKECTPRRVQKYLMDEAEKELEDEIGQDDLWT